MHIYRSYEFYEVRMDLVELSAPVFRHPDSAVVRLWVQKHTWELKEGQKFYITRVQVLEKIEEDGKDNEEIPF